MESRAILELLESLPANERVHGHPAKDIARILRESLDLRDRLIEQQRAFPGQGGKKRYSLTW